MLVIITILIISVMFTATGILKWVSHSNFQAIFKNHF